MKTLFLASSSPRRKELLEKAGFQFRSYPVKVSEFLDKNLNLDEAVKQIARQKAYAAVESLKSLKTQDFLIISSDTVVVFKGEVFGKPENKAMAYRFLGQLSGATHEVKTSICMVDDQGKEACEIESSFVTFRSLSEDEIWAYIETGDPMDKAGAYGIQAVGKTFISELKGSLDNVMGLSIALTKRMIEKNGWIISKNTTDKN